MSFGLPVQLAPQIAAHHGLSLDQLVGHALDAWSQNPGLTHFAGIPIGHYLSGNVHNYAAPEANNDDALAYLVAALMPQGSVPRKEDIAAEDQGAYLNSIGMTPMVGGIENLVAALGGGG